MAMKKAKKKSSSISDTVLNPLTYLSLGTSVPSRSRTKKEMKPAMKKKSAVPPNDLGPDRTVKRAMDKDGQKVKKANSRASAYQKNMSKVAKGKK
jgi:hypothetical protein